MAQNAAVKHYCEALSKDLPSDILGLIQDHAEQVFEAHDRISTL